MKICFLTHSLNAKNGWGRYSLEVVKQIAQRNEVEVLVEEASGQAWERRILNNSLNSLPAVLINALRARKYIKQSEIIHCLDAYPYGVIAALANLGLKKRLIINSLGSYGVAPLEQPIRGWLLRWAYKRAVAVFCISSYTQKEILKRISLSNSRVIYLGVDFDKFQAPAAEGERRPRAGDYGIILSVGALKRRKGYHISIPAFGRVKEKYPHSKYYIVGSQANKDYFRKLRELVKDNNLENDVVFLSGLSDEELVKLYRRADLFVLTPVNIGLHFEGFGLVYLEAAASAKPVIGTYGCGAEEAVEDNKTGLLVPQNDIEATAQAMLKILDNPELAKQMGRAGWQKAREMSWSKTASQYLKVYEGWAR